MTDLFRGYDLTAVVDTVAERQYGRMVEDAVRQHGEGLRDQIPTWEAMSAVDKRNYKESFLPIVSDVLEALESDQVKPTEAKQMVEYGYARTPGPSRGDLGREDPRFYENQHPAQHDTSTATVWTLHLRVRPEHKDAVLERMSVMPEVTGEYTYDGDSFTEWGTNAEEFAKLNGGDPLDDQHLAIYFEALPHRAREVGDHLADHAAFAVLAITGEPADVERYVSTSGDYAEQV